MVQISKKLVVRDKVKVDNTKDLIDALDVSMAEYYCTNKNYEKGLESYKKVISNLNESEKRIAVSRYIEHSLNYGGIRTII